MELSKRCIEKNVPWNAEILTVLATRLGCLKMYLGNTEFLLKGFSPLFTANNAEIEGKQK